MPAFGIYRLDPQPTQRGTFRPIPAQGDAPPLVEKSNRYQLATIRAAWVPPPPPPPRDRRYIVVLVRAYGDPPPISGGLQVPRLMQHVAAMAWKPPPPLPTLPARRFIAPQTLEYGDAPPRAGGLRAPVRLAVAINAWTPGPRLPTKPLPTAAWNFTLTVDSPPVVSGLRQPVLFFSQFALWKMPDPLPTLPARQYIAPQTLAYGDQPPATGGAADIDVYSLVYSVAWQPAPPSLPRLQPTAAWNFDAIISGPPIAAGLRSPVLFFSQFALWHAPDPLPTLPARQYIAPQTLAYGDQPPRYSVAMLSRLIGAHSTGTPFRQAPKFAPITVSAASKLLLSRRRRAIE